jgi:hypothetical protein
VTSYAINEKIDPAVFSHEFPAGTPVKDAVEFRYFVVQQDGSKRAISPQEYFRLAAFSDSPTKQGPPKKTTREISEREGATAEMFCSLGGSGNAEAAARQWFPCLRNCGRISLNSGVLPAVATRIEPWRTGR